MLDRKEAANGRTWTPASWLDEVVRTLPDTPRSATEAPPGGAARAAETPADAQPSSAATPRPVVAPSRASAAPTLRGRAVAVIGAAAGVGKTVVALNLAAALVAETAKRVAVVDLDVRMGTAASALGLRPERDVRTALDGLAREDDGELLTHLAWAPGGFQLLAAPATPPPALEAAPVAELLARLLRHFDYLLVDTPPTADAATVAALEAAAFVVLVTTPEPRSRHAGAAYVAQLGERGFPLEKLRIVLNRARADGRTVDSQLPIVGRLPEDPVGARAGWRGGDSPLPRSARGLVRTLWPAAPPPAAPLAAGPRPEVGGSPTPAPTEPPAAPWQPAPRARSARGGFGRPRRALYGGAAAAVAVLAVGAALLFPRGASLGVPPAAPTARPATVVAIAPAAHAEVAATGAPVIATRSPLPTATAAATAAATSSPHRLAAVSTAAATSGKAGPSGIPPPAAASAPAAVATPAATSAPPPSPTSPPRNLFDERFVDNVRGWPNDRGATAWIEPGWYQLAARTPGMFVALTPGGPPPLRDVAVSATFKKTGGPAGGGYGVILRAQSALDGLDQSGRYYVLEVGDRGEVGAWRREDDRWVDLLPWTRSPAVKPDQEPNRLTALALGSRLTLIVNDQIVANLDDYELKEGRVGVFVGGDGNEVALEWLRVQAAD